MSDLTFGEGFTVGADRCVGKTTFKYFDWDKFAELAKENNYQNVSAGLLGDWGCTSGEILTDGQINTESYTYLYSLWATPAFRVSETGEEIACYKEIEKSKMSYEHSQVWPESARSILEVS